MICNHAEYTKGCKWCEERLTTPSMYKKRDKLNSIESRKARKAGLYVETEDYATPYVSHGLRNWVIGAWICLILIILLIMGISTAHADNGLNQAYSAKLANAIYIAEGGRKTVHPYGVLTTYKHTSPRQACINTINHKYRDWVKTGKHGDFIVYLGSKYAPVNSNTDVGTNKYWVKNVKYYMEKNG